MKRSIVDYTWLLCIISLGLVACGGLGQEPTAEVIAPPVEVQTVVVVATPTPAPEPDISAEEKPVSADAPMLEAPTAQTGEPTMTTLVDLNVRTGPGTAYTIVGALRAGSSARIIGKSPNGYWWKIECPARAGSACWSSAGAQYSTAENTEGIPIAAVPPLPTTVSSPTVVATANATQIAQATATLPPGTTATATATLPPGTTATATPTLPPGTTATATYTSTPTTAATHTPTPTSDATASPTPPQESTATSTYTPTPSPTTAETQIAPFDNDSLQNPAVSVFLSPTGQRNFSYSDAISYVEGDQDDWVEFEFPNNANVNQPVWVRLNCTITGDENAQLRATLWQDGASTTQIVLCNAGQVQLTVNNTQVQQLRIHFGITGEGIYAEYTLEVVGYQ